MHVNELNEHCMAMMADGLLPKRAHRRLLARLQGRPFTPIPYFVGWGDPIFTEFTNSRPKRDDA